MARKDKTVWPFGNSIQAIAMGWDLFTDSKDMTDTFRVQKIDDPENLAAELLGEEGVTVDIPSLKSDSDAVTLVRRLAKQGNRLCKLALTMHGKSADDYILKGTIFIEGPAAGNPQDTLFRVLRATASGEASDLHANEEYEELDGFGNKKDAVAFAKRHGQSNPRTV